MKHINAMEMFRSVEDQAIRTPSQYCGERCLSERADKTFPTYTSPFHEYKSIR